MRSFTVFLSIASSLFVGCSFQNPVPAAEADVLGTKIDEAGFGDGRVWEVGPDRDYKTPSAVADLVGDGDVVLIDAATYSCDAGVIWYADRLTLKGVGGRPRLDAENCDIPGGKGIWNPAGTDLLVDNIEFSGASVSDENGAGIRFEGRGRVIIRNAFFHHSENGILFTPDESDEASTDLLIEHSEFAFNGTSSGQSHNLYINGARSFTFRYNFSHDALIGHLVKSRARTNHILYNRLMTMAGTNSYEIDLPNGGDAWVIGNIIQQGAETDNAGIISLGTEFDPEENRGFPGGHLYVVNNTMINDRTEGADLVTMFDYDFSRIQFSNNIMVGIPDSAFEEMEDRGVVFDNNLITDGDPGFLDRTHHNYALKAGSAAIDAGVDPGSDHLGLPLSISHAYRHPVDVESRLLTGNGLDLGALEYSEDSSASPTVSLTAESTAIDYGADAELQWTSTDAERCFASNAWDGDVGSGGSASIGPLNHAERFALSCDGPGGSVQASIDIAVADHPLAKTYPNYHFVELDDTQISPLCREDFPFRGTEGCDSRYLSAAYVPEQNAYYMFGGADRSYFGNEVIRLDLSQSALSVAFGPSDPRETRNFNPNQSGGYWNLIEDCSGVWDLNDGGVVPAPADVFTSWIYAPSAKKIFKGGGQVACGSSHFDTDSWWFDPFENNWHLLQREGAINPDGGSHAVYDPDSKQLLIISSGTIYRFNPETEDLVELGPYDDLPWSNTPVLDPVNDVVIILGSGTYQKHKFMVIDIRGLDRDTNSLPEQVAWTATGDLSLIERKGPGLAYDEDRNVTVGWDGGNKLYFLKVDRDAHEIEFIARTLNEAPVFDRLKYNTFLYAKQEKAFVTFTGVENNFYLLKADD